MSNYKETKAYINGIKVYCCKDRESAYQSKLHLSMILRGLRVEMEHERDAEAFDELLELNYDIASWRNGIDSNEQLLEMVSRVKSLADEVKAIEKNKELQRLARMKIKYLEKTWKV